MRPGEQALIRPSEPGDRGSLVGLLEDSYFTTWAPHVPPDRWQRWSREQRPAKYVDAMAHEFVVAAVGREIAGMVHWRGDFIHALHVHSRFRRRGLGTQLLSHAEDLIAQSGLALARLETDSFNTVSRAFYADHGYTERGSWPNEEWSGDFLTILLIKDLNDGKTGR
jgi:ribosomal protein S18 acetylase RimI-like enzyme